MAIYIRIQNELLSCSQMTYILTMTSLRSKDIENNCYGQNTFTNTHRLDTNYSVPPTHLETKS